MSKNTENKDSRLIPILREGVAVIQMIFFKECKQGISARHPDLDNADQIMLAGAITNELFGCHNPEEKFQEFRNRHKGLIEQELFNISNELPHMTGPLSDALRIQILCDNQEDNDSTSILQLANSLGILANDRDLPMPSVFMETVRTLGAVHKLIIPPVEIDTKEEHNLLH